MLPRITWSRQNVRQLSKRFSGGAVAMRRTTLASGRRRFYRFWIKDRFLRKELKYDGDVECGFGNKRTKASYSRRSDAGRFLSGEASALGFLWLGEIYNSIFQHNFIT